MSSAESGHIRTSRRFARRLLAGATAVAMSLAGVVSLVAVAPSASADTAPPVTTPATPTTVSADALPTVQINGVVWSQVTVGNTVYAAGDFTSARPAGAAAGVNETTRNNLLAYDITTGNLITSFNHGLNAPGMVTALSPDGTRLYVGGDFTNVGGAGGGTRGHIAAFNTATGALISTFTPSVDGRVKAIAATNTTVYFGGSFDSVNGVSRTRLAAVSATDGSLLSWSPTADDNIVSTMLINPSGDKVVVGGQFSTLDGQAAPGLGALDPISGALLPFAANQQVQNSGPNAGITSLTTDGTQIYGTGFVFGAGGNLEGIFAADGESGAINWIDDCHGDNYDTLPLGSVIYTVSHSHFCGDIGAFPQTNPWTFERATAFTTYPTGTVAHNPYGGYKDWFGSPAPTQLDWYPTLTTGTYTGQSQAAWSITGNSNYIALGGEFPTVNSTPQQGLVRFAIRSLAPNTVGPRPFATLTPKVTSLSSGTARVGWQTTYDQDNEALTYKVVRDGVTATPVYTVTVNSKFWDRPTIGFTDTGLTPGSTHSYRVYAYDPIGNSNSGSSVPVTIGSATTTPYQTAVKTDGAIDYWRLGESSGTTGYDWAGFNDLVEQSAVTDGAPGAVSGDPNTAATFDGSSNGSAAATTAVVGPDTFTEEAWFQTTSTAGGKIIGLGDAATGTSSNYDRQIYLDNSGHVIFGVYSGGTHTITTTGSYSDGAWHHVVGTLSSAGQVLYVDGIKIGQNTSVTAGQPFTGYWRIGGDNTAGWPAQPSSNFLAGNIDEVAIYPTALTANQVLTHYNDAISPPTNQPPVSSFTATCTGLTCTFDGSASTDADGTVTGYAWNFGDGSTANGVTTTHTYPAAGPETVTLTVTDNSGATGASSKQVSPVISTAPLASDAFNRTVTGGLGTADKGGAWTTIGTAGRLSVAPAAAAFQMPAAGQDAAAYLPGVSTTNAETDVTLSTDKVGTGGGIYEYVAGRRISANNEYHARIQLVGSAVTISLSRLTGSSTDVAIGSALKIAGLTYTPGMALKVRFQVLGTNPTTLNLKVWNAATTEPSTWQLSATDSTPALQANGSVSLRYYLSGSATNAPVVGQATNFAVLPPGGNVPPSAAFTSTCTGLTCTFDGTASSDSDGTLTNYAWNFGDGTTAGPSATTNHTYAANGTYNVTLIVTDNGGATGTVSHAIAPAAGPVVLAADSFNRTVANGLGTADTGGAWTTIGTASRLSVAPGAAALSQPAAGQDAAAYLPGVSSTNTETDVTLSTDKVGTGGGIYEYVAGRRISANNEYHARIQLVGSAVTISLSRLTGSSTDVAIGSALKIAGLTYTPGMALKVRFQVFGTSPTTLNLKVWNAATTEPSAWQITATDSTAGLQVAGAVSLRSYLSGSATNAPVVTRASAFSVVPAV